MDTYQKINTNDICDFCNDEKSNHQYNGCLHCTPKLNFCNYCFENEYEYITKFVITKSTCKCHLPETPYLDDNEHNFIKFDNSTKIKHVCILCNEIKNNLFVFNSFMPCVGDVSTHFCNDCLTNRRVELNDIVEENSYCFLC